MLARVAHHLVRTGTCSGAGCHDHSWNLSGPWADNRTSDGTNPPPLKGAVRETVLFWMVLAGSHMKILFGFLVLF